MKVEDRRWPAELSQHLKANARGASLRIPDWVLEVVRSPLFWIVLVFAGARAATVAFRTIWPAGSGHSAPVEEAGFMATLSEIPTWLPSWEVLLPIALCWYLLTQAIGMFVVVPLGLLMGSTLDRGARTILVATAALLVIATFVVTVHYMKPMKYAGVAPLSPSQEAAAAMFKSPAEAASKTAPEYSIPVVRLPPLPKTEETAVAPEL